MEWKVEKSKETVVIVRCGLRRASSRKEEQVILQGWGKETISMFPFKQEGPVKRKDTVIVLSQGVLGSSHGKFEKFGRQMIRALQSPSRRN